MKSFGIVDGPTSFDSSDWTTPISPNKSYYFRGVHQDIGAHWKAQTQNSTHFVHYNFQSATMKNTNFKVYNRFCNNTVPYS